MPNKRQKFQNDKSCFVVRITENIGTETTFDDQSPGSGLSLLPSKFLINFKLQICDNLDKFNNTQNSILFSLKKGYDWENRDTNRNHFLNVW